MKAPIILSWWTSWNSRVSFYCFHRSFVSATVPIWTFPPSSTSEIAIYPFSSACFRSPWSSYPDSWNTSETISNYSSATLFLPPFPVFTRYSLKSIDISSAWTRICQPSLPPHSCITLFSCLNLRSPFLNPESNSYS